MTSSIDGLNPPATDLKFPRIAPGVVVSLHIKFFETSNFISANQAKSPFISLNNKILHKPLVVKYPFSSRMFRLFEHLEMKLQLKVLLSWTAKQILLFSLIANPFNISFPLSCCEFLSLSLQPQNQYQPLRSHKQHRITNWVNDDRRINGNPFQLLSSS